jgi:hypothetical protein
MLIWLRTYWPVAILVLLMFAIMDGTLSSLLTCHPAVSANPNGGADHQQAKEYCSALNGPILTTLRWIGGITHKYEGLITAAFTIVLAVFTARLWFSTEKMSDSTKRLVEGAEDTAQRQLRAYIVAGPTGIVFNDLLKDIIVVEITIKNTGQTPAREVLVVSRTCVLPYPLEGSFDFTLISGPDPSKSVLGKDQDILHESTADAVLTGDEMMRVTNPEGGFRVYTYGRVDYRDVFDHPQHTHFCCTNIFRGGEALGHTSEQHNDAS